MKRLFVFYTVLTALIYAQPSVACTTMIVDKDASDGVWVAQRVPDDHFFVAANQFRIRDVEESENMLFSSNIFEVAESKG